MLEIEKLYLQTRGQDEARDCAAPQLSLVCQAAPSMAIYYFLTPVNGGRVQQNSKCCFLQASPSWIAAGSLTPPIPLHLFDLSDSVCLDYSEI